MLPSGLERQNWRQSVRPRSLWTCSSVLRDRRRRPSLSLSPPSHHRPNAAAGLMRVIMVPGRVHDCSQGSVSKLF